jgi:23S rRNA pseudouridine1911/1915/1917 synthase
MQIKIPAEYHLVRIDVVIGHFFPEITRSEIHKWFDLNLITLQSKAVKKNRKAQTGEIFLVAKPLAKAGPNVQPEKMDLDIRYEDDDLLVLNKPKGIVVHPGSGITSGTLVSGLLYYCQNNLSTLNGTERPGIVHRLDKDTSGLMIVAKNDLAHSKLSRDLEKRSIKRIYHCLVWGHLPESSGTIDAPVGRNIQNRLLMCITDKGRKAVSHYKVLELFDFASLIEVSLETGRTHQIRVHMNHLNTPVIGDPSYRGREYGIGRTGPMDRLVAQKLLKQSTSQALQAVELSFQHPRNGENLVLKSEYHKEFATLLNTLRTSAKTQFE